MNTRQIHDRIIGHDDLAAYAAAKANLPKSVVDDRRTQLGYLTRRPVHYIGEHPDYDLVKIRGSGSAFPHEALTGAGLIAAVHETRPTSSFREDRLAADSAHDLHPTPRTP